MQSSPATRMRCLADTALASTPNRLSSAKEGLRWELVPDSTDGSNIPRRTPRPPLAPIAPYSSRRYLELRDEHVLDEFLTPEPEVPPNPPTKHIGVFSNLSFYILCRPNETAGDREMVVQVRQHALPSQQIGGGSLKHITTASIVIFPTEPGKSVEGDELLSHLADLVSHSGRPCLSYAWLFHSLARNSTLPYAEYAVPVSCEQSAITFLGQTTRPHTPHETRTPAPSCGGSPLKSPLFTPVSSLLTDVPTSTPSTGKENKPEVSTMDVDEACVSDEKNTVKEEKIAKDETNDIVCLGDKALELHNLPDEPPLVIPPSPPHSEWLPSDRASSSPDPGIPLRQKPVSSDVVLASQSSGSDVSSDSDSSDNDGTPMPPTKTYARKGCKRARSSTTLELPCVTAHHPKSAVSEARLERANREEVSAAAAVPPKEGEAHQTFEEALASACQDRPPSPPAVSEDVFSIIFGNASRQKPEVRLPPQAQSPSIKRDPPTPLREMTTDSKGNVNLPDPTPIPESNPVGTMSPRRKWHANHPPPLVPSRIPTKKVAFGHDRRQSLPAPASAPMPRANTTHASRDSMSIPTPSERSVSAASQTSSSRLPFGHHWTSGSIRAPNPPSPTKPGSRWKRHTIRNLFNTESQRSGQSQHALPARPRSPPSANYDKSPLATPARKKRPSGAHEGQRKRSRPSQP